MAQRRYYVKGPRILAAWQNIGLGILDAVVPGITVYLLFIKI